jgi:probable F420-dependent oxidoreductase
LRAWRDRLRRIEDSGFAAVSVSDHVGAGWGMEPLSVLAAAATATERVRLMTLVLNSDIRHPALIHHAAATIDVISEGRLELGLGAGWKQSEYAALGVPFARAEVRVGRLAESVEVIKGLFSGAPFSFRGQHHQIEGLVGAPEPVQRPHPPILLAGAGREILALAGREAAIAGVAPLFGEGRTAEARLAALRPERARQKLGWLRDAARAAGRDPDDIELQLSPAVAGLDGQEVSSEGWLRDIAADVLADPGLRDESPYVLVGDLAACTDRLEAVRARFGFSCIRLPGDPAGWTPLVSRLAGR